jgi:integrase
MGLRISEAYRLRWEDCDLEHNVVVVRRGWDKYRKKEKTPKNKTQRTLVFTEQDNIMPLLRWMQVRAGGKGLVFEVDVHTFQSYFEDYLDRAGLTRYELRNKSATQLGLTPHGLRGTCATWRARRGDNPFHVRRFLGHEHPATTDRYFDDAQLLGGNVGEVFPPLPASLYEDNRSENRSGDSQPRGITRVRHHATWVG